MDVDTVNNILIITFVVVCMQALIEVLDQVEDVTSVEPTIPKDRGTLIGTERSLKADNVVNRFDTRFRRKNCHMGFDVSFLVLVVCIVSLLTNILCMSKTQ